MQLHYSPWTWFSSTEEKVHRPLPLLALEDGDPTDPDEHVEGGPGQDFPNAWQLPEGSYDGDESNNFGFSHLEFYWGSIWAMESIGHLDPLAYFQYILDAAASLKGKKEASNRGVAGGPATLYKKG